MQLTPQQVAAIGYKAGWRGSALVIAVAVSGAEAGYNTAPGEGDPPHSPTFDYGLWQINGPAHPQYDRGRLVSDPVYNAGAAYAISNAGASWSPWTTYKTGAYKAHMAEAQTAVDSLTSLAGVSGGFGAGVGVGGSGEVSGGGSFSDRIGHAVDSIITDITGVGGAAGLAGAGVTIPGTGGVLDSLPDFGSLTRLLGELASGSLWRRLGLILAGVALVGAGAAILSDDVGAKSIPGMAQMVGEAAGAGGAP